MSARRTSRDGRGVRRAYGARRVRLEIEPNEFFRAKARRIAAAVVCSKPSPLWAGRHQRPLVRRVTAAAGNAQPTRGSRRSVTL